VVRHNNTWTRLTLALLLLLWFSHSAYCLEYFVSTGGSNANSCTAARTVSTAKRDINNATGCLASGDTVTVKAGLYAEGNVQLPSGSAGAPTTIRAAPGETVTLQPNNISIDQIIKLNTGQSYITIDGLILDAGSPTGTRLSFGTVVNQDHDSPSGHHFTVKNCEVKNGRHQGLHIAGANWTVENNHIHHNGTDVDLDHGIYFSAHDSLVKNNNIHDNRCFGIQNYSSTFTNVNNNTYIGNTFTANGCGVVISQGSGHLFMNNVMHHDATRGTVPAFRCCSDGKYYNNTIVNNVGSSGLEGYGPTLGSGVIIKNNIICGNNGAQIGSTGATMSNNLTTCPTFVNSGANDYHLVTGSAALGAGTTLTEVTTDKDGVPRPQPPGGVYDIGAYEGTGSGGPPPDPPLAEQMFARWTLDEGTGTSAADATGNGRTGTLSASGLWSPGRVGKFAITMGVTDMLTAPTLWPLTAYTWAFWLKAATAPTVGVGEETQPFFYGAQATPAFWFSWSHVTVGADQAAAQQDTGGGNTRARIGSTLLANRWYHLAATWDGTTLKHYLNGVLQASTAISTMFTPVGPVSVGNGFVGSVDDVRLYNFPLDGAAILVLYRQSAGMPRHRMSMR
jgi:hypothetical protein